MILGIVSDYYWQIWRYFYQHYTFKSYYLRVNCSFKLTMYIKLAVKQQHLYLVGYQHFCFQLERIIYFRVIESFKKVFLSFLIESVNYPTCVDDDDDDD